MCESKGSYVCLSGGTYVHILSAKEAITVAGNISPQHENHCRIA